MKHERETLDAVITARNAAVAGLKVQGRTLPIPRRSGNSQARKRRCKAAWVKCSPWPRPIQTSKQPEHDAVPGRSSRPPKTKWRFARQAFNDAVMTYNNGRENFPNNLLAGC